MRLTLTLAAAVALTLTAQEASANSLCWPWQTQTVHRIVHARPHPRHITRHHGNRPVRHVSRRVASVVKVEIACPVKPPVGPLMSPWIDRANVPDAVPPLHEMPMIEIAEVISQDAEPFIALPSVPRPYFTPFFPPPGQPGIPSAHPVPEPSTWLMLIVGFLAVGLMLRERHSHINHRN